MDNKKCVANRTRSKGYTVVGGLTTGKKRRRRVDDDDDDDDDVICLGDRLSVKPDAMEMDFEFLGESEDDSAEVVEIKEDDDEDEEEFGGCEKKTIEVKKEEKDEEFEGPEGCSVAPEKGESFVDDDCGSRPDKPVVMMRVGQSEEKHGGDETSGSDDRFVLLSSSSESDDDDDDSSDDDFKVDVDDDSSDDDFKVDVDDEKGDSEECSSSEEDIDDSSCDDESGGCKKFVKERVRNPVSESENGGLCRRKGKRNESIQVEEEEEKWNGADCASVTSSKSDICKGETKEVEKARATKRVESVNVAEIFVDQCPCPPLASRETFPLSSNSKQKKPVEPESEKEISMLWDEFNIALQETETGDSNSTVVKKALKEKKHDKGWGVRSGSYMPKRQEKMGDSAKVVLKEDGRNGHKDGLHEFLNMSDRSKNKGFKFFIECFHGNPDSDEVEPNVLKEKDGDVVTQPLASRETVPLTWDFLKKKPVEKSEAEKELDMLWAEMDMLLRAGEIGSRVENEDYPASHCKHDTIFNEEVGMQCRWCGWIETEIRYITPPFVNSERSGRRVSSSVGNDAQFNGAMFNESGDDSEAVWSLNDGTIWDLIPGTKEELFHHQQEGIEFIWENLAGTTDLAKLKRVDPCSEGGCIISHAPGTGKTRLTMVFLHTYLQMFPKCRPVIIAPANILLTWEDELRKWNIGFPFHNLNSAELSGKENALNEFGYQELNKDGMRMVKLCSWYKEKSILLISYNLYEKLAGGKSEDDGEKEKKNLKIRKEKKRARNRECIETVMGKVLRDCPGLLVLDEGHTPRNQRSCIWKVLSESRSQKRILLSGTPFQNNFLELFNILCLMKPSFSDSIPQQLKKFCQSKLKQERQASKDVSWEPVYSVNPADEKINQLKLLMNPFVHVHKGSILQKNLPGLKDCVLVLKPEILQQKILESIECSQNALNFEHKLSLVSVHPSLFLKCSLSKKEESVIDMDLLKKCRLDPYAGVKTKFLKEFVNLCDAVNEKVLVFSQFIDTLCLIKDQLESAFNWSEGTEILYMHGRLDQKQKQSLIHSFNDKCSQAKVFLASIKASSEGINLIGASRVVLLDVVWNPSVERQAICRAYRLGQEKVVYTYHLLAQDTPECTKYCKQAEKNRVSELVFSNRNAESDKLNTSGIIFEDNIEDRVLDHMVQHEKLKDMFGKCLVQPTKGDLETLGP